MYRTIFLLVAGCTCGGPPQPTPDGDPCAGSTGCASGACFNGACAGGACGCGGLCGTQPRASPDCDSEWSCVPDADSFFTKGRCMKPCHLGCPEGWACRDGWCSEEQPPLVTIEQAPAEIAAGATATFKASATSPRGTIDKLEWSFEPGATVEGFEVAHTFARRTLARVVATATDSSGVAGTAYREVTVCIPSGAECVPFSAKGYCCTGLTCGGDADAGTCR